MQSELYQCSARCGRCGGVVGVLGLVSHKKKDNFVTHPVGLDGIQVDSGAYTWQPDGVR